MKNLFLIALITFFFGLDLNGQTEVPPNPDSLAMVIGKVKSVTVIGDTTVVTNLDGEQFQLVGENVGALVGELLTGIQTVRENVGNNTDGKPIDWVLEIIKWILGGSLTSVIAYGSRSINGVRAIFAGVLKNRRLVVGIAGAVAFAYLALTGGDLASSMFYVTWGGTWFTFAMFAIGLYDTIFSRFVKTEKTEAQVEEKVLEAKSFLESKGAKVSMPLIG